jgi:hypothetical protein
MHCKFAKAHQCQRNQVCRGHGRILFQICRHLCSIREAFACTHTVTKKRVSVYVSFGLRVSTGVNTRLYQRIQDWLVIHKRVTNSVYRWLNCPPLQYRWEVI